MLYTTVTVHLSEKIVEIVWINNIRSRNAEYICINKGEVTVPVEIKAQSIAIDADINSVVKELIA